MNEKITKLHIINGVLLLIIAFFILNNIPASKKFISQGSSYSYTRLSQNIQKACVDNVKKYGSKENCYTYELNTLSKKEGPEVSFQVLNYLQQRDKDAIGCHLMAHGIGAGSFEKDPINWRVIIQNMPTICNYGGVHGVIESYIVSLPDKSLKKDVIPTICGDNPRADCNHIVGHLLLVETDADMNKALDLCEVLTDVRQNDYCLSGVFMEFETALNLIEHNLAPKSWLKWEDRLEDLEKVCRSYSGKRAEACWEELVHVAAVKFKNDPKKTFDFCNTAQVPNGAKRCKRHGLGIIGATKNFDLVALKSMCEIPQPTDPNFQKECYPALISSALSTVTSKLPQSVNFCSSLDEDYKVSCFNMVGIVGRNGGVPAEDLANACEEVPEAYYKNCLGTAPYENVPIRSND